MALAQIHGSMDPVTRRPGHVHTGIIFRQPGSVSDTGMRGPWKVLWSVYPTPDLPASCSATGMWVEHTTAVASWP